MAAEIETKEKNIDSGGNKDDEKNYEEEEADRNEKDHQKNEGRSSENTNSGHKNKTKVSELSKVWEIVCDDIPQRVGKKTGLGKIQKTGLLGTNVGRTNPLKKTRCSKRILGSEEKPDGKSSF